MLKPVRFLTQHHPYHSFYAKSIGRILKTASSKILDFNSPKLELSGAKEPNHMATMHQRDVQTNGQTT